MFLSSCSVGSATANPHASFYGAAQLEIDHRQGEGGLFVDLRRLVRVLVLDGQLGQRDRPKARNGNHVPKTAAREESSHPVDQRTFHLLRSAQSRGKLIVTFLERIGKVDRKSTR